METNNLTAGFGSSQEKDYLLAIKEATQQARANLVSSKIEAAFLFTTFEYAHPNTLLALKELIDTPYIFGASSAVIFTKEGFLTRGVAIMLICLPKRIFFQSALAKDTDNERAALEGEELGKRILNNLPPLKRDLCLFFTSVRPELNFYLLTGIRRSLGSSFPIIGAVPAGNIYFPKTHIYLKEDICENGALAILFGGRLNFGLGIKHGWNPLGKPHYVTKAERNIVYEIDGSSATNLYEDYFAYDSKKLKKELLHISRFYPLGIYLDGERQYILRNIASFQDNGALLLHGNVAEGSQIRLMIGNKESCLAATKSAVDEAKQALYPHLPKFALVFDSISRYFLLGRSAHEEIKIITNGLGKDTPFIGLCSLNELSPLKSIDYRGEVYLHNQSIVVLTVGG